jgi:alpha-ketoglutarate-dependent sulfate ester dioxygenase
MTVIDETARISIEPASGYLGAQIRGVNLAEPLEPEVTAQILDALIEWKVLFFKDQDITPERQISLGNQFGVVNHCHPTIPPVHPQWKEIFETTNELNRAVAKQGNFEYDDNRFHIDQSFVVNPPAITILRGVVIPPYGGDTTFTDLQAAYAELSKPVRDMIDVLHAVHENITHVDPKGLKGEPKAVFEAVSYKTIHPVVRVHPVTGKKGLLVAPGLTSHLDGLTRAEADAIINLLYGQLARPDFTVRFRWNQGDVVFIDNRSVAHRAPGDLRHLDFERVLHRVVLRGDIPTGPDGFRSQIVSGIPFGEPLPAFKVSG